MNTLYQFPFSHFCEKARWALDYKGQPYTLKNLLPGPHMATAKKLAPRTSLPILVTADGVIQGSGEIIDYLDRTVPAPPLTPRDPDLEGEARRWESYLDEQVGVTLRCWFYYYVLPQRPRALSFLLRDAAWYGRPLFSLIYPKVRDAMIAQMQIDSDSAREAERRMGEAFTRVDEQLGQGPFLTGKQFSRADLTACALLAPLCLMDEPTLKMLPAPVVAFRQAQADRPFFRWVARTYREFRPPLPKAA